MAKKAVRKLTKATKVKVTNKPLVVKKPFTKSELINVLVGQTLVSRTQSAMMINALRTIIEAHLSKKGPGVFTLPGVVKFRVIKKPAVKARKGINPFTGESMIFKAKPARNVIKVRLLKQLKDAVK